MDYKLVADKTSFTDLLTEVSALNKQDVIAIDFETTVKKEYFESSSALDPYCNSLRLLSINWLGKECPSVIDIWQIDITPLIKEISNKLKYTLLAHNASFEIKMIGHHYGVWLENLYCSMTVLNTLYVSTGWRQGKSMGASLSSLMKHFVGRDIDKTLQISNWGAVTLSNDQLVYSALDVNSDLITIFNELRDALINVYDEEYAFELDQGAMRILGKAEYQGFYIDKETMIGFIKELAVLSNKNQIDLAKRLDLPLTIANEEAEDGSIIFSYCVSNLITKTFNNPSKLMGIINKKYGIKLGALNKLVVKEFMSGVTDDDEDDEDDEVISPYVALESIVIEGKQEAKDTLKVLLDYKYQEKLIGEIGKYINIINPVTGALHATTNPVGAGTGRMSSSSNIFVGPKKYKMNLQQVVAKGAYNIRSGFVARPGYKIAGVDFSTQEVLTAMAYAMDEVGLSSFFEKRNNPYLKDEHGVILLDPDGHYIENPLIDSHIVAAMGLCPALSKYDLRDLAEMAKGGHDGVNYRFQGKILNFSVIYGKTAAGLSEDLKCTVEEAQEILDSYFRKYPGLKKWLDKMSVIGVREKRIRLPTGRWLWCDEANSKGNDKSASRKAGNGMVQGFCADQLKITLPYTEALINNYNTKYKDNNCMVAVVHDEIVFELKEEYAEELGMGLKQTMEQVQGDLLLKYMGCDVGGFASISIGNYWSK